MTVTVLMLGHKSLSGKDTFIRFAQEKGYARAAFADKLKSTVADLYGFSHEQMHGELKDDMDERYLNTIDPRRILCAYNDPDPSKEEGLTDTLHSCYTKINPYYKDYLTPRRVLQIFGQDQRKLFPDIWAAYVFYTEIPRLVQAGYSKIAITDFRFKNEAKVALEWASYQPNVNLKFVKIDRPTVLAKTGANDISENDLNDFNKWDYILSNNGSLDEYRGKVLSLVNNLY